MSSAGSKVLQAQIYLSPLFLPVVAIHAFATAFSITGNQRRDYYDGIQYALMVGSNLPLNHAITVINLLSALIPVMHRNLLPKRQRARRGNRGEEKNSKGNGSGRDW